MARIRISVAAGAILGALPLVAQAQFPLMIPDSGAGDRIMLFDGQTGALIDANWITDLSGQFVFTTPKEAAVVRDQIWVSDQVADAVHRFDLNRNYLGSITQHTTGNLDNLRGFSADGENVYLTMFHGTTTLRGVVTIDIATATATNFWPVGTNSLFDTLPISPTELLVANNTTDDIERRNKADGSLVNVFAANIEALQFLGEQSDGSIITASTIAAAGIEGVYHLNPDGTIRKFIDTEPLKGQIGEQVPRAAWVLGDGGYLIATSDGVVKAVETAPGVFSFNEIILGVDAQFINPLIPEPASLGAVAIAGVLALRRRRG